MIDLCKIFGVEEGEEFKFGTHPDCYNYRIISNRLSYYDKKWFESSRSLNELANIEVIKLPKKKEFTDDELCILRNADKKLKWIARDYHNNSLKLFTEKPQKNRFKNWLTDGAYRTFDAYNHLFNSITSEDEEPVFIDDYVERK